MAYTTVKAAEMGQDQVEILANLLDTLFTVSGSGEDLGTGNDQAANQKPQEEQKQPQQTATTQGTTPRRDMNEIPIIQPHSQMSLVEQMN